MNCIQSRINTMHYHRSTEYPSYMVIYELFFRHKSAAIFRILYLAHDRFVGGAKKSNIHLADSNNLVRASCAQYVSVSADKHKTKMNLLPVERPMDTITHYPMYAYRSYVHTCLWLHISMSVYALPGHVKPSYAFL